MKRPKGPELKLPELKAPEFVADLYYDLRDRRLLPLVALIVVAIAAVPFLLGGDSDEELTQPAGADAAAALESAKARSSTLAVVEAEPGLRDYRERLRGRQPSDPFRQGFDSGSLKGAQLNEKAGGSAAAGETSSTSTAKGASAGGGSSGESADGGSTPPSGAGGGAPSESPPSETKPGKSPKESGGSGGGDLTFYAFAIDVKIVKSVDGKAGDPTVRKHVLPQTPLPGEKQPVVTYMGAGRDGKKTTGKALLLVSDEVAEIAGDAKCVSGDEVCQLLEVEPGFPILLGLEGGVRYKVNVLKLDLVVTGHG